MTAPASKEIGDVPRDQRVDHVADGLRVEQADAGADQQRDGGDGEARELRPRQRQDATELDAGAGPVLGLGVGQAGGFQGRSDYLRAKG